MSTIPNPMIAVPVAAIAKYRELRERIEAGDTISYREAEEKYTDDMLWADAWRGHEQKEEAGEGYFAADLRVE